MAASVFLIKKTFFISAPVRSQTLNYHVIFFELKKSVFSEQ